MRSFEHFNASSLEEAVFLMGRFGTRANLIAGGTDLLGVLKGEILPEYPEAIINLKSIPNLDYIREDKNVLKIGSMARLADIVSSSLINERYPIVADAAKSVGTPELRNMGTIGGNICQENRCWYYRYPHSMGGRIQCFRKGKGPCLAIKGDNRYHAIFGGKKCYAVCPSDMAIVLTALQARVKTMTRDGQRDIPMDEFYDPLDHVLEQGEIVKEIEIPQPSHDTTQRFIKFRLRESVDFAIVSVATAIEVSGSLCKEARIVLGGVAPTPYRVTGAEEALKGKEIDTEITNTAAEIAVKKAKPLSQNAYKVEITKSLIRKALAP